MAAAAVYAGDADSERYLKNCYFGGRGKRTGQYDRQSGEILRYHCGHASDSLRLSFCSEIFCDRHYAWRREGINGLSVPDGTGKSSRRFVAG